jgi:AAA family ATP:ADP antiporter
VGGEALGAERWFVWAMFILVDIYSTVMVAIFWTYTNDVVSRVEADRLYIPIGVGGILGGVAGGVAVDALVAWISPVDMLLVCTAFVLVGGALAWATEAILKPAPRVIDPMKKTAWMDTFEGARAVLQNRYLLAMVGIVLAYEFAATLTDFVINLVFESNFHGEVELAQMYGRLGWIVSSTALVTQLLIVPVLLPSKKIALLVPPLVMAAATVGLAALPVVSLAILAAASDRGLNYSLQQVTKETLYLPLSDLERYKAKAFIDVFVDRAGKAFSSVALLVLVAFMDVSPRVSLALAFTSLMVWVACASVLGTSYAKRIARGNDEPEAELEARDALPSTVD